MEKEVIVPKDADEVKSTSGPETILAFLAVGTIISGLLWLFFIKEPSAPMYYWMTVPTTHEIEPAYAGKVYETRDADGNKIRTTMPERCLIYRGAYAKETKIKGRWIMVWYDRGKRNRENECLNRTLFLMPLDELKGWDKAYAREATDAAEKAFLLELHN